MPAGAIAGERIRALAAEGVPGVVILVAEPDGVRAAGGPGLLTLLPGFRPRPAWCARGFR